MEVQFEIFLPNNFDSVNVISCKDLDGYRQAGFTGRGRSSL